MSIVLNPILNLEKLSLINTNFTILANAINQSLVWRTGTVAGETLFARDLDLNSHQLLNAKVGGFNLSTLGEDLTVALQEAEQSAANAAISATASANSAASSEASNVSAVAAAVSANASAQSVAASAAQINTNTSNISALDVRLTAEETKVQPIALGGTGNTTGLAATATALATARTLQTNLASTTAASFNGTANASLGVTGTLPLTNGGTGATTASAARTALGAAASVGVVDGSNAAAGVVGEVLTATTNNTAILTATSTNATSLTLSPGDWEVNGVFTFTPTSASYTVLSGSISTTSATLAAVPNRFQNVLPYSVQIQVVPAVRARVNVSVATTVYLVANITFASGTSTVSGYLEARRIR